MSYKSPGYCIVLDLDETLVRTQDSIDSYKELGISTNPKLLDLRRRSYLISIDNMDGDSKRTAMWGITRPHLERFLVFCFSYFDVVAVWSAGTPDYVAKVVQNIFRGIQRPHIVWSRDKVLMDEGGQKPLVKMIGEHPSLEGIMRLDNTIILDDKPYTFKQPNPANGILIPPYNPEPSVELMRSNDIALLQVMSWILTIRPGTDIRLKDKSDIFRRPVYT